MKNQFTEFKVSDYLSSKEDVANYLEACLAEGGIPLFLKAVGDAARASGMSEAAEHAGVTRASLYKSLSEGGSPALATIDRVMNFLGLKISIEPIETDMVMSKMTLPRSKAVGQVLVARSRKVQEITTAAPGRRPPPAKPANLTRRERGADRFNVDEVRKRASGRPVEKGSAKAPTRFAANKAKPPPLRVR
jgi:probable addiction module antidote protein